MSLSSKFKIRCSAIGQIMTEPRTKKDKENGVLSKTAKTYCENWLKETLYKRSKDIKSKYLQKGTEVEQQSINLLGEFLNKSMLIKNEQYKENDFITGTPDIVLNNSIIEIKSSWDCFTFPLFETQIDNNYEWQTQGYMELFDKGRAVLAYCLVDTPEDLIDREIRYKTGEDIIDVEWYEKMREQYIYSNLPASLRVKTFNIERNPEAIKAVEDRVIQCRKYIDELINKM